MAECAHKENLLLGDPITGVVFRRFWELLLVCAASLTSGLMWMTYSTAQDTVEGMYPGWKDNSTLPTLALWGPAVSVIGSPAMPLLVARYVCARHGTAWHGTARHGTALSAPTSTF